MPSSAFVKDPQAILDYSIEWAEWLSPDEVIITSTWTVPAGITKDSDSNDSSSSTVWLSGGTAGDDYRITNTIATNGGRTNERTFTIRCRQL